MPSDTQSPDDSQGHGAADYEVGYGRPPVATRFKAGQSGNPSGRAKGTRNLTTVFNE